LKVVLQRVSEASVEVSGKVIGSIGRGLLLLVGAEKGDTKKNADIVADRVLGLRIFEDDFGKMNFSVGEIGAQLLAVSQFTLSADISKGRRPSFSAAMPPEEARKIYDYFVSKLKESGLEVKEGEFGARMKVRLGNDGPVTFVIEG
jgi:D-tyrosyl-tRNA(Tyr) deacylase